MPGISQLNFNSLIGTSLATELGHLDQERKNIRSTKSKSTNNDDPNITIKEVYIKCYSENEPRTLANTQQKIYSDQTDRFLYKLSRGSQYLLVMYDYDSNVIMFQPLKSRQSKEMAQAFTKCCNKLRISPKDPNLFVLNNKCSKDIRNTVKIYNGNYQLVPPHQH